MQRHILAIALLVPMAASATTIYKCRALYGGQFWSSSTCTSHNAVFIGSATVPKNMTFEQQVAIAEQGERRSVATQQTAPVQVGSTPKPDKRAECQALADELDRIAALQRRALPPQEQDRLTAKRREVHDQYNALKCGAVLTRNP